MTTQPKKLPRGLVIENQAERIVASKQIIAEQSLKLMHIRPALISADNEVYEGRNGGLTLAYRHLPGNSFIELSTSICSPKDAFCRKVGATLAAEEFQAGRRIRIPAVAHPTELLQRMFQDLLTFADVN